MSPLSSTQSPPASNAPEPAQPAEPSGADAQAFQAAMGTQADGQDATPWWKQPLPDHPTNEQMAQFIGNQAVLAFIQNPPKIDLS